MYSKLKHIILHPVVLGIAILVGAFAARIYGINWDQYQHLHPDERFLTMVAGSMKIPQTLGQYLQPSVSTLNPSNIGFGFYVYGTLPVVITKIVALVLKQDTYDGLVLTGRLLSACVDSGVLVCTFLIARLFESNYKLHRYFSVGAAFFYAITVFAIQQSHFFTVDPWLAFFALAALYAALLYYYKHGFVWGVVSFVLSACAIASKVSALYILPLVLVIILFTEIQGGVKVCLKTFIKNSIIIGCGLFVGYLVLRLAAPYYFESASLMHSTLNAKFIHSVDTLGQLSTPSIGFPPAVQWITKTKILFPLQNILIYGLGPGMSFFLGLGLLSMVYSWLLNKQWKHLNYLWQHRVLLVIIGWAGAFFVYQGTRFGMTLRYFYLLYPLGALVMSYGVWSMLKRYRFMTIVLCCIAVVWPMAFMNIYSHEHSRITAARWVNAQLPNGSVLAGEYWDDGLPLGVGSSGKSFGSVALPVFEADTDDKWNRMNSLMNTAQYYVLSSNRGYASILSTPDHYPRMSSYYQDLFSEKTIWTKAHEIVVFPEVCVPFTKLCYTMNDQGAEEAFTVYDHPKVLIYKKK